LDYKRAKEINKSYIDDYQRNKRKSHIIYSCNNHPSKINYKQCLKSEFIYNTNNNNVNKLDNREKRNNNYNNHVLFISKSNDNFKKILIEKKTVVKVVKEIQIIIKKE
jgi:hypothetical protein